MKIKPNDRQNLLDLAIRYAGDITAAFELAADNDVSIVTASHELPPVEVSGIFNKSVSNQFKIKKIEPATDVSQMEIEENLLFYGGIGYMAVEIDFTIS